eukprot:486920_1
MGLNTSKDACEFNNPRIILSQLEWEYLTKRKHKQKDAQLTVSLPRVLLINGYFRQNGCDTTPLDLIFVCYDFYALPPSDLLCFERLLQHKTQSKNDIGVMQFTLFKDSNISYAKTRNILINTKTIQYLKDRGSASCYVPNISEISSTIPLNSSAIIRCGQLAHQTPTLPNILSMDNHTSKDHCSGIIFNRSHSNNNNTLHGIEMDLPSFRYSMVDDLIYFNESVIAYQSFDVGRYNKLFYLNKEHSQWQLLTKVSWSALSPAILCGLSKQKNLFITTKAGESVIYSLERDEYVRTSNMILPYKNNNADVHCIAYNEENKIYRGINGNTYYFYSLHKNMWYDIPQMTMKNEKRSRSWHVDEQTLFINPQSPYVLNTRVSASRIAPSPCNQNRKVLTAYFDQRDSTQKWTILS